MALDVPRRHLYTAITPYQGVVYRDDDDGEGPRDVHALDYPFAGAVVELIDANKDLSRAELVDWLRKDFIPKEIGQTSALMCLICVHEDLPKIIQSPRLPTKTENGRARVVLLWFVEQEPSLIWEKEFADHEDAVRKAGLGNLVFAGPFIPTIPGTNRYVDELR